MAEIKNPLLKIFPVRRELKPEETGKAVVESPRAPQIPRAKQTKVSSRFFESLEPKPEESTSGKAVAELPRAPKQTKISQFFESLEPKPEETGKEVLESPPACQTPKKRKISQCSHRACPEPVSRGELLVQLARQKAQSTTPRRGGEAQSESPLRDSARVSRRIQKARRRLTYGPIDYDRQSEIDAAEKGGALSGIPSDTVASPSFMDKAKGPKLSEFGYIEFSSPTKKEKASSSTSSPLPSTLSPGGNTESNYPPLPASYQLLAEQFRSVDTIVAMLMKRKEICTFVKLKKAVQQMTRRNFEQRNLGQMKSVYPLAYEFRQEKIPREEVYHLTVECTFSRGVNPLSSEAQPQHLYPTSLVQRRRVFRRNLNSIVKLHHQKFLSSLDPPLEISNDDVRHWHPKFPLERVPAVEAADLPAPPMKAARALSVKEVLSGPATAADNAQPSTSTSVLAAPTTVNPALRGISKELLERIRAKEANKAKAAITRTPLREKQLGMMDRFPHLVRVLHGCFIGEKRAAIPLGTVLEKVVESRCLSPDRVEEHLTYLTEVSEGWISTVAVRNKKYVKLDRKRDVNNILTMLSNKKKLLEVS